MKYKRYPSQTPLNVNNLKTVVVAMHLNYLHTIQLDMIDEAVEKSDLSEAKDVISYIMEKSK
jgi:hypothetical protein